ncbi:amino acid adenylation domain-containing protein [Azospirillum halopraeferens]|uniref:amino acid adenylation domain-containing protein n=1 Tax=Azospirillum halopraeferens TaxID=34010 RepID=UPI0004273282|nr:amino acid adenylation domain-containing protein [Azospirillum halopraeferens]
MPKLLHDLVSASADRHPTATAVVMRDRRLTYRQLDDAATRLAHCLRDAGCRDGDRVGLMLPKSPDAVVAMLGVLKARCLYVPIDVQNPAPRAARIVDACRPRVLLAAKPAGTLLENVRAVSEAARAAAVGWLEGDAPAEIAPAFGRDDVDARPATPLDLPGAPQANAHILFTSGSTGLPKGVVIPHAAAVTFVEWATDYFGYQPGDRVSGHAPFHFDLSTFDIYGALSTGAELHLVPPELNLLPAKLAAFIREHELTQWFSVPSVMNFMARMDAVKPNDFPSLTRVLWCGEVLPTPALIHWMERLPHVRFTNLYGPTEATIASSFYTVPSVPADPALPIPIGTPCAGERMFVLDDAGRPAPAGEIGHLFIAGAGLADGYWEDPEKTAAAFVPAADGDGLMYRTGDLAKRGEDGLIHFVGRADTQIKSRGYRIELGEIEAALGAVERLKEYAVVAVDRDAFEGATICCAYAPNEGTELPPAELRTLLAARLPGYMLPTRWAVMDPLPKNANGKIDRRRLQDETFATPAAGRGAA